MKNTPILKKLIFVVILLVVLIVIAFFFGKSRNTLRPDMERSNNSYNCTSESDTESFQYGYKHASENDIDSFKQCQEIFGTGDAEDGCNEYVKKYYSGYKTFHGYECTEDCSGHEAGYEWAEENNISDEADCDGNSASFIEGCIIYVRENN